MKCMQRRYLLLLDTDKTSTLEKTIRTALKQCPNIIIDACRLRMRDDKAIVYLAGKCKRQEQIKRMLYITKRQEVIDIFGIV